MHTYRSHTCGELRDTHIGQQVRLSGWIQRKRDLGGMLFADLRDNYGLTQIVAQPGTPVHTELDTARVETVITVDGTVRTRGDGNINTRMPTGAIEVEISSLKVQGSAELLPFPIVDDTNAPETTRLSYRFLDLRRNKLHQNILLRSRVISSIRRRMTDLGFNEFQTPILTSSSPEGARDYLVPSRLYPGKFYALPQAPQQFKQLLMVSGFDRYFQIAPCFRDEDARADRSPGEFYQLDVEMSFVTQDDVFEAVGQVIHGVFTEFSDWQSTPLPFPRIPYAEAMRTYGSDKPDLRFGLKIQDVSDIFAHSGFKAFESIVKGEPIPMSSVPESFKVLVKELNSLGLAVVPTGSVEVVEEEPTAIKPEVAAEISEATAMSEELQAATFEDEEEAEEQPEETSEEAAEAGVTNESEE